MKKLSINIMLITAALVFCTHTAEAGQNSAATIHIDVDTAVAGIQTSRNVSANDVFDVDIVIKGASNLGSFNLVVTFPHNILQIQPADVTKGGFFPFPEVTEQNPEGKVFFLKDLDMDGNAKVTGIVLGIISDAQAPDGGGVLARLRFKVLSEQLANIVFSTSASEIQSLGDNGGIIITDDPVALGNSYGARINSPHIPCDINGDGFISIIGDVPPFVDCVYFGNCLGDVRERCDINGDGFVSIIGDVPPFVDCVYFGNCP